jgi:hypothetical protein
MAAASVSEMIESPKSAPEARDAGVLPAAERLPLRTEDFGPERFFDGWGIKRDRRKDWAVCEGETVTGRVERANSVEQIYTTEQISLSVRGPGGERRQARTQCTCSARRTALFGVPPRTLTRRLLSPATRQRRIYRNKLSSKS